jgi:hypothetical protein
MFHNGNEMQQLGTNNNNNNNTTTAKSNKTSSSPTSQSSNATRASMQLRYHRIRGASLLFLKDLLLLLSRLSISILFLFLIFVKI